MNAGGDIVAVGGKTNALPWKIRIRDPNNKGRFVGTVELRNHGHSNQRNLLRPFNDIFNPRDGTPAQAVVSSTVVAERAIDADILATSLFVLGVEKGKELIGALDRVKSFVVANEGRPLQ